MSDKLDRYKLWILESTNNTPLQITRSLNQSKIRCLILVSQWCETYQMLIYLQVHTRSGWFLFRPTAAPSSTWRYDPDMAVAVSQVYLRPIITAIGHVTGKRQAILLAKLHKHHQSQRPNNQAKDNSYPAIQTLQSLSEGSGLSFGNPRILPLAPKYMYGSRWRNR